MDISTLNSLLSGYETLALQKYDASSSGIASKLTTRLLNNRDSDSDGYLTNSDVSELSSNEFSTLDTDGDGKLSTSEITSAFETQIDSIKGATQSGGNSVLVALRSTPAGKLFQAMKKASSTTSSSSTSSISSTTSSSTTSSSSSSSILDVTV